MYNSWEENAKYVKDCCGSDFVNYDERYYHCPKSGELIYECDWRRSELLELFCSVCERERD